MATENITLHRAHEIVAAFHRRRANDAALDKVRDDHNRTAADLEDWLMVHGGNPRWHVAIDAGDAGAPIGGELIAAGQLVGFEGLAGAATRLLAWHDGDPEFVEAMAEQCAEAGVSSVQCERDLWETLRQALAAEGMPDAAAVYDRRRRDARTAAIRAGGLDIDTDLVSVRPRTAPAFVQGNFAQRLREAIEICALALDDRRKLIVETPARMVEALTREADWKAVPGCFAGDARIVGSFNGVPVRQEHNTTGALILLAGEIIGVIYAGDQTPGESERDGERRGGA